MKVRIQGWDACKVPDPDKCSGEAEAPFASSLLPSQSPSNLGSRASFAGILTSKLRGTVKGYCSDWGTLGANNKYVWTVDIWGLPQHTRVFGHPYMAGGSRRQAPAILAESRAQEGQD